MRTMDSTMEEALEPRILEGVKKPRRKLGIKPKDIIIFLVIVAVIVGLTMVLLNKLQLKRDVAGAKIITDQVIADIPKHNGAAVRKLGNAKFQSTHTDATLLRQFAALDLVTVGKPVLVDQIRSAGSKGTTVFMVYRYPPHLANQPFYISVAVTKKAGTGWLLTNLSGSADETKLLP